MADDKEAIGAITGIMLAAFRLNAQLLAFGDRLVAPLGLTSARWQVLGAIALAGEPQTAPQIAAAMGMSRQAALKQLHLAEAEGFVAAAPNPRHERSPLYELTARGRKAYAAAISLQRAWARGLAAGLPATRLRGALDLLTRFEEQLARTPLPAPSAMMGRK